jgi:hypothetical protein
MPDHILDGMQPLIDLISSGRLHVIAPIRLKSAERLIEPSLTTLEAGRSVRWSVNSIGWSLSGVVAFFVSDDIWRLSSAGCGRGHALNPVYGFGRLWCRRE